MDVLVLGATGYTGRLVAAALDRLGARFALGGRNLAELKALAKSLHANPKVVLVDVRDPDSLDRAFGGVKAVVNTVGPFLQFGQVVVEAAIRNKVHYVDTTAEQSFQRLVRDRYRQAAREAGIAVVTAQAVDFAPSCLAAHILEQRFGPLTRVDSWHWLDNYKVSKGTAQSALGMVGAAFSEFRDGREQPLKVRPYAKRERLPCEAQVRYAVPFPGGDTVLLPAELPALKTARNYLVLPAAQAHGYAAFTAAGPALGKLISPQMSAQMSRLIENKMTNPDTATRQAATWTVLVRGQSAKGTHYARFSGRDVYASTGEIAARGALTLAQRGCRQAGVVSSGAALDAKSFSGQLSECQISFELFNAAGQRLLN